MTTEIYSCKDGQSLKQGKLDYDSRIETKEQAASDALRRVGRDPTLRKVAYYKVSPDGEFRVFYSYTNPNVKTQAQIDVAKKKPAAKKPPPKKSFWGKLKESLGL